MRPEPSGSLTDSGSPTSEDELSDRFDASPNELQHQDRIELSEN